MPQPTTLQRTPGAALRALLSDYLFWVFIVAMLVGPTLSWWTSLSPETRYSIKIVAYMIITRNS